MGKSRVGGAQDGQNCGSGNVSCGPQEINVAFGRKRTIYKIEELLAVQFHLPSHCTQKGVRKLPFPVTQLCEDRSFLAGDPQMEERMIILLLSEALLLKGGCYVPRGSWHALELRSGRCVGA